MDYARAARRADPVRVAAVSTVTPTYPEHGHRDARTSPPTRPRSRPRPTLTFRDSIAARAPTRRPGIGPDDLDLAEVYDLSTALELDWYENIGLCKAGEAEQLLHDGDTTIGGRIPVNPSGGLACFGEAVPAQAHRPGVRGRPGSCGARPATARSRAPRVGLTVNQGLFGHGSSRDPAR